MMKTRPCVSLRHDGVACVLGLLYMMGLLMVLCTCLALQYMGKASVVAVRLLFPWIEIIAGVCVLMYILHCIGEIRG
jgi:hypothetical protein